MDCPIEKIVSTKNECEQAALYLNIDFRGEINNSLEFHPAGCYWSSTPLEGTLAFFNGNLDPSSTLNANFKKRGGICVNKGKYNLKVCCNHILL